MLKKILLAYNGTREGKSALLACAELATFANAETHLLAVANIPSGMFMSEGFFSMDLIETEKKHGEQILREGVQQLKELGFDATGHLAVGEPVIEICNLASALKVDLIVIGHQQKVPFAARWWRGSVGKALLEHAPCSIYIARTKG